MKNQEQERLYVDISPTALSLGVILLASWLTNQAIDPKKLLMKS